MNNGLLFHVFIFLAAACIIVPLASRFKLGSVLGYLIIGVLIGPFGFNLIANAEQIMHFSEFGVIMMLFLIGLELEPDMLWKLRKVIVGLGSLQVILTTLILTGLGLFLGYDWRVSLAISMALSLSSTALVLQILQEKNLMHTATGEVSFAVLLFQDIAVIPILILMPMLSHGAVTTSESVTGLTGWSQAGLIAGIIGALILAGHYLSHHFFYLIAQTNLREVFTATSLALIVGITLLMEMVGVSPGLGAFIGGVVLANSEYKRTLETDIEPFKGLLLGLFFISVGMSMNFHILTSHPVSLISIVLVFILIKIIILLVLGRFFGLTSLQSIAFALVLSQGSEFAFVLFQFASSSHVIRVADANFFTLAVALSMATTPFLVLLYQYFIVPRFLSILPPHKFDDIDTHQPIILAGYGRFGQIIGRFLNAQGIELTVLEKDPEQIELLRKFGIKGYFGDASRLDLLKNAGAGHAKLLIVAVDDPDTSLEIVKLAKQEFPQLKVYSRARNRRHAYELHKAGVDYFKRETFDSSLSMAQEVMKFLGFGEKTLKTKAKAFAQHDEATLQKSFAFFEKEHELISFARQANGELERILQDDQT
ncbi:monovalent cation:proton antiporter-2 (CPA2) family protein [Legionella hackeliae]|uniref:Glutathione-regulated potassium-efflux system protein kefC n=1 Tax=Legionella hackeliae TaxID=449 RepID=A0A0A8UT92_LEGHA|nr:monovalent cation:proton antiporter-2 (CPA2) family protein [Legionella hackeliae]KTD12544.1 glutathione-regulated potassium efflux system [Legionella hackeliae]CEK11958.1 Glutathione-regulated potassium-efflux system protein kefC [Legionella hackeliae]STX48738.1 monovalent cation-H antiporter-2, CPA2 family [Legionella hackeliae]